MTDPNIRLRHLHENLDYLYASLDAALRSKNEEWERRHRDGSLRVWNDDKYVARPSVRETASGSRDGDHYCDGAQDCTGCPCRRRLLVILRAELLDCLRGLVPVLYQEARSLCDEGAALREIGLAYEGIGALTTAVESVARD